MRKILLLVCMMTVIFGCLDDEEKAWTEIEIPTPAMSRMLLTEFCKSDGIGVSDVTKREEFSYQENWLTDYIYSQEVSIADLTETITNPIAVRYENNRGSVTLTDETGIQRKYTLNEQGYATQCKYTSFGQKREYTFSYTDGYLTLVKETLPKEGSSEATTTQTLSLKYEQGDLVSATCPSLTNESFTGYGELQTHYEPGKDINYYRLPCPVLADTYPLSFHREAMFAGILGKPTQHLTVASYPDQTGDTYTERTEYSYSFDKKNKPTGLHIQTKYGNGKSMNYINRTINISIE
ncbi:DUF4595 domain-containing protein [Bacteroides faecis]|uniref:DUF4595 domain-containing protein n=1 Tax=Bacteroides faecis TaxID=674529 RepID=UPI0034A1F988